MNDDEWCWMIMNEDEWKWCMDAVFHKIGATNRSFEAWDPMSYEVAQFCCTVTHLHENSIEFRCINTLPSTFLICLLINHDINDLINNKNNA